MAENFSIERRRLMRFLGAKVVLTPAADKGSGMLAKAIELAETHGALQEKLRAAGVSFDADAKVDYDALLPKWLKKSA